MKILALTFLAFAACVSSQDDEIVIFDGINLANVPGVTPINGLLSGHPAYRFSDSVNDLISKPIASKEFAEIINLAKVFIFSAYARTNNTFDTPIISFLLGTDVAFGVRFGWKPNVHSVTLSVTFRVSSNPRSYTRVIPLDSSVKKHDWVFISAIIHKDEKLVRFKVNDKFFSHIGIEAMNDLPTLGNLRLAQELSTSGEAGSVINRYVGDLQNLTVTFGKCFPAPILPTNAPTTSNIPTTGNKVVSTPSPKCPSKYTCVDGDGYEYQNGEKWEKECKTCFCENGTITCFQNCNLNVCVQNGKAYLNGAVWFDSSCQKCECRNNKIHCSGTRRTKKTAGCERTCSDPRSGACPHQPRSGCFCPPKMVSDNGNCVSYLSCGCNVNGRTIKGGDSFLKPNQEICVCVARKYICTKLG